MDTQQSTSPAYFSTKNFCTCLIIAMLTLSGAGLYVMSHYVATSIPYINRIPRNQLGVTFGANEDTFAPNHTATYVTGDHWQDYSILPSNTLPITLNTGWVKQLRHTTMQLTGQQIVLLLSDERYLDVLLNWMVHVVLVSPLTLKNVLIISLDTVTHQILQHKQFHSIYVPRHYFIRPDLPATKFSHLWVIRLIIIRLLNSWNYDVLVFDSDAVLLRNIQPLLTQFAKSDIVSSSGSYPFDVHKKWGVPTLCMGVILIRSSPKIKQFWQTVESVVVATTDDQVRVNKALDKMGIQWQQLNHKKYYRGMTTGLTPLIVTTLPSLVICRHCRESFKDIYYVWHHHAARNGTAKRVNLNRNDIWLLRDDWNKTVKNFLTGTQWIRNITRPHTAM